MAVYVDNSRNPQGKSFTSHLIADTTEELLAMATRLGLQQVWMHSRGTWAEHFDIAQLTRERAIEYGAVEIDKREFLILLMSKRDTQD